MTEDGVYKICEKFSKIPRYSEVSRSNLDVFAYESDSICDYDKIVLDVKDFSMIAIIVEGTVIVESFTGTELNHEHIVKMLIEIFIDMRNMITDGIYTADDIHELFTTNLYKSMSLYNLKYRISKNLTVESLSSTMDLIYNILSMHDYLLFVGWQVGYNAYILDGY